LGVWWGGEEDDTDDEAEEASRKALLVGDKIDGRPAVARGRLRLRALSIIWEQQDKIEEEKEGERFILVGVVV